MLVFAIVLALIPSGLFARSQTVGAVAYLAVDDTVLPAVSSAGMTGSPAIAVTRTPCVWSALPRACTSDIGMPVDTVSATAPPAGLGHENSTSMMVGLSPGCLVGPPQSR